MRLKQISFWFGWLGELCNAVNDNNNIPDFLFKLSRIFFSFGFIRFDDFIDFKRIFLLQISVILSQI